MLRRHRCVVVTLPDEIVELILSRLAVKSLLRFKCVSKKWKSTIECPRFKEAQLRQSQQQSGDDPDILYVMDHNNHDITEYEEARIPVLGSSSMIRMAKFPSVIPNAKVCYGSCDGLVCLFSHYTLNMVANPATRWHQSFPLSRAQQIHSNMCKYTLPPNPQLGFGKDKFTGTYKPVWLCNSSDFGLPPTTTTTCEVFDFSTNAWRYVLPASPYRILDRFKPVFFDGSLYWLTECTKLLSFDLHTETFQVICKPPFSHIPEPEQVLLCILDNTLCVSQRNWPTQVIWSFHNNNTSSWKELCTIDLTKTFSLPQELPYYPLPVALPLALLEKKTKLLFGPAAMQPMVIHDFHTKSYHIVFSPLDVFGYPVPHFDSLFSLSPNS
ncbi:F-box/LRR-repeat/kelch-repeat protein [Raphanus sativus]|nr:F-box/LRR-repeat/kelch-repeat protein [Raphanus sativus]